QGGAKEPEKSPLSEIIERFNERFGTQWTEQDVIKPFNETLAAERVQLAAVATPDPEAFAPVFDEEFENKMAEHFDSQAELGRRYFDKNNGDFRSRLNSEMRRAAWNMIRRNAGLPKTA